MSRDFRAVEANDNKKEESATDTNRVGAVEHSDSNSLPSSGEGAEDGAMQSLGGSLPMKSMDYLANSEEVSVLVKHWRTQILRLEWVFFIYGQTGSSELRTLDLARGRIDLAYAAIGKEAVDQAIEEAQAEFKGKINDDRLWNIFENGTQEQWEEVCKETYRKWGARDSTKFRQKLEELEAAYPGDVVALVLRDFPEDKRNPVLVSATLNPKLAAALQASGEFTVETDKDMISSLVVGQKFTKMGFLRIRRENGEWRFYGPGSKKNTIGWEYLRWVMGQIEPVLKASTGVGTECA